jgi:DNA-binding response OmpR family regulator
MATEHPHILIAEDDAALADLLSEALGDEGYTVALVQTADEARSLAQSQSWDLFVVDSFDLWSTAGPSQQLQELARDLAERAPVIVTTAHSWAVKVPASQVGVAAILPKPFDLTALFVLVQAALS